MGKNGESEGTFFLLFFSLYLFCEWMNGCGWMEWNIVDKSIFLSICFQSLSLSLSLLSLLSLLGRSISWASLPHPHLGKESFTPSEVPTGMEETGDSGIWWWVRRWKGCWVIFLKCSLNMRSVRALINPAREHYNITTCWECGFYRGLAWGLSSVGFS